MDALEQDASEVLRLVRSVKNSFAPINRIPPEVLLLIPDYYDEEHVDQASITLTHVCRSWRETFTSCSSLWTRLDFSNVNKTLTYIQRSQSSPFRIYLKLRDDKPISNAFALVIPHIRRLKSLTIDAEALPGILQYFRRHAPLLEKLDISIYPTNNLVLDGSLFNGDLSSLHHLRLHGLTTDFPWERLPNLRVVNLHSRLRGYGTTQLLDFFESAPLLHTVSLAYPMPDASNPPPERVVPLLHLKEFSIRTKSPHSILLRHIQLPVGASLISEFRFRGEGFPLLEYLQARSPNLRNLSHITMANLLFNTRWKYVQLTGPSGTLRVVALWETWGAPSSFAKDREILRSLDYPTLSTIQRLSISKFGHPRPAEAEECPILQTLSSTHNLRTLILINCNHLPFVLALNPEQNPSNLVVCPNMQNLTLYIQSLSPRVVDRLTRMAKNRASRGAKLSSITLVDFGSCGHMNEVLELREHVTHVEYCIGDEPPAWDDILGEVVVRGESLAISP